MATNWTTEQQNAIHALGGRVLVSAAAGSGKTAVLVERAVTRILSETNNVSPDKLLLVTFSNAAAGEMRARISARLDEEIARNPQNGHLLHQRTLLGKAHICTIDSFCIDLLKSHFTAAGLPPDFRIAETSELTILQQDAIEEVLEECYKAKEPDFLALAETLSGKNDKPLEEAILRLGEFVRSHPFPKRWLQIVADSYTPEHLSEWMAPVLNTAKEQCEQTETLLRCALTEAEADEQFYDMISEVLASDIAQAQSLRRIAEQGDWNGLREALMEIQFPRFRSPKGMDAVLKDRVKQMRDSATDLIKSVQSETISCTMEEASEDLEALSPVLKAYCRTTILYLDKVEEKKQERSLIDFSDAEEKTLELLVTPDGDGYRTTEFCETLSHEFDEICIDEFQDTNEVQDLIFTSLSQNEKNLFLVGDVKQSIYGFRQAMPELFVEKRAGSAEFDGTHYPAKIMLSRNFRSRDTVTETVNFIFSQLMKNGLGENEYDASEALIPAAEYPENPAATAELHCITSPDGIKGEAEYLARRIRCLVESGYTVSEKSGDTRPVTYGDICILLRSTKNNAEIYASALREAQIPVQSEAGTSYFSSREISLLVDLLRVLTNPSIDISMLAVLYSPIFGYTSDDIAALRVRFREGSIYRMLQCSAEEGDTRAAGVLELLDELRRQSVQLPLEDMLRYLYDRTGLLSFVQLWPNGARRAEHLRLFLQYAKKYAETGGQDLGGFLLFLDRCKERGEDLGIKQAILSDENAVHIMSIHHSKGLEFPVCILADSSHQFNKSDLKSAVLLHHRRGIGWKRKDAARFQKYPTLPWEVICNEKEMQQLSEELRILYVALTRAKEKLILLVTRKDFTKKLTEFSLYSRAGMTDYAAKKANSFADWILLSFLRHPDAGALRDAAGVDLEPLPASIGLDVYFDRDVWQVSDQTEEVRETAPPDTEWQQKLQAQLSYQYPYAEETLLPMKLSVSEIAKPASAADFSVRPVFLQKEHTTGAERGNALHTYMQFADFSAAAKNPEAELQRLVEADYLTKTQGQWVSLEKVRMFFESDLGQRLLHAERVEREYAFMSEIPASVVNPDLQAPAADAKIVIQGIADCLLFEPDGITIVDYKTDRVKHPFELIERYQTQLQLYRFAMEDCFDLPVKGAVIYSFGLSTVVPVPTISKE